MSSKYIAFNHGHTNNEINSKAAQNVYIRKLCNQISLITELAHFFEVPKPSGTVQRKLGLEATSGLNVNQNKWPNNFYQYSFVS